MACGSCGGAQATRRVSQTGTLTPSGTMRGLPATRSQATQKAVALIGFGKIKAGDIFEADQVTMHYYISSGMARWLTADEERNQTDSKA